MTLKRGIETSCHLPQQSQQRAFSGRLSGAGFQGGGTALVITSDALVITSPVTFRGGAPLWLSPPAAGYHQWGVVWAGRGVIEGSIGGGGGGLHMYERDSGRCRRVGWDAFLNWGGLRETVGEVCGARAAGSFLQRAKHKCVYYRN